VLDEVDRHKKDPTEAIAYRIAAAKHLAAPDVLAVSHHRLLEFAPLLEPNPRAMKRFLNEYGLMRTALVLTGITVDPRHLAQLLILQQRWPKRMEWLINDPDQLNPSTRTLQST
jgi:hypothetical protein